MEITLMTAADFGNKRVVLNLSNSRISGEDPDTAAYVPEAQGGMPTISSIFLCLKNKVDAALMLQYIRYIQSH
jgi:hypothetical protein